MEVKLIDIDLLVPSAIVEGRIPKPDFKTIDTAKSHGIEALPVVKARPHSGGPGYEILSNIMTWMVAQNICVQQVPTLITDVSDEVARLNVEHDVSDNKEDPIEEARHLQALVEQGGLNVKQAGELLGRSRTEASHRLRLLKLDPSVQELVSERKLEIGHGKVLAALSASEQKRLAQKILNNKPKPLSVRNTELEVRKIRLGSTESKPVEKTADHIKLEEVLSSIVGSKVTINELPDTHGHGHVTIEYQGYEVLDGILERLGYTCPTD